MKLRINCILILFLPVACTHRFERQPSSEKYILPVTQFTEMVTYPQLGIKFRAGYSLETSELKGCVLYLQGLADSILNHKPYFSHLNQAGYRVIFFDYMGQGGSQGKMNNTRVKIGLPPNATKQMILKYENQDKHYEIPEQGDFFWSRYKGIKNGAGQSCEDSPKIVIGWSTGGLSAYSMAHEKRADAVILIAPGIHPNIMVGESASRWDKMLFFRKTISERTLTRNRFEGISNPHVDPISPGSPMYAPQFAGNLLITASNSTRWKIDSSVRGLVFLSGQEDSYVDREKTVKTLNKNAPQFEIRSYDGALHELDNETPDVANDLYVQSIKFLDSISKK